MIVVSDTSPLTSLLQIGQESLLQGLYGTVIIPEAVERELRRTHTNLPPFLKVASARNREEVSRLESEIDTGEAEAIALAKEIHADALLIDEKRGRAVALREGVPVIGLLGVLIVAKKKHLITSLAKVLNELEQTSDFRLATDLKSRALREVGENE
jgi:predicted nucleic acid-binding protein